MRAIDLYSGIGGWTIGLECAGIDVVKSYEWCPAAVATAQRNLNATVQQTDITKLKLSDLPKVEVVVGSPPCTDFSFSNRGGSGDIKSGLKHVLKFLAAVEHIGPEYWAMENVPRLATILLDAGDEYPQLRKYRDLLKHAKAVVLDASEFGLPQRRQRCIVGNIRFDLLDEYMKDCKVLTLGDVVRSLKRPVVKDVNYGIKLPTKFLTDHHKEPYLDWEEVRINREAKAHHPVYNHMSFPDKLNRPVRTITATCTRVSRESIVISEGRKAGEKVRRLTIRERATLQGFPVTYQLDGGVAEKMRLVGNAMPPILSYYIAKAIRRAPRNKVKPLSKLKQLPFAALRPNGVKLIEGAGYRYPVDRRFRFAIAGLRFGSGMRFDLANQTSRKAVSWSAEFYFGPSTDIRTVTIDKSLYRRVCSIKALKPLQRQIKAGLKKAATAFSVFDASTMQARWVRKVRNGQHPFRVVDAIGAEAKAMIRRLKNTEQTPIEDFVLSVTKPKSKKSKVVSQDKLRKNALAIFAGLLVSYEFNRTVTSGSLPKPEKKDKTKR